MTPSPTVPAERIGLLQVGGKPATIVGADLHAGDRAPEFAAHTQEWQWLEALAATRGTVRIIAALPSLDTPVCDLETRTFNKRAAELGPDVRILVISTDLPYAQKRWCGSAGVDQVTTLSDHMTAEFGVRYGCLIKERRILRRATFVVDRSDTIVYAAYTAKLGDEPEYDAILDAARQALEPQPHRTQG
jgi:thioredoxin-dependent peroxiredoxin